MKDFLRINQILSPDMKTKILKNEHDYSKALKRTDEIFNAKAVSPHAEELALLLLAIKDYEDNYHRVPLPNSLRK